MENMNSSKKKEQFALSLNLKFTKKYRFMTRSKPYYYLGKKERRCSLRRVRAGGRKDLEVVKAAVCSFYLDDETSAMTPGIKDTITRKKVKKQKRYLTNSLKYLHAQFCESNSFVISYSLFCRLRPFWAVHPNFKDRDTCLCSQHENFRYMCEALKRLKIVASGNPNELIKELMCSPSSPECFFRTCACCVDKDITFNLDGISLTDDVQYDEWDAVKETDNDGKIRRKTKKFQRSCKVQELVTQFYDVLLQPYIQHCARIRHQASVIRKLKDNPCKKSLVVHVDFSENYNCKYGTEIQVIHFGGNRPQICLHTGVLYRESKPKCFCTVSPNLDHNQYAILIHLQAVLGEYTDEIEHLHFVSDSPATQYRNQFMFHIM